MNIVHGERAPLVPVPTTRAGELNRRDLVAGEPGTPGNFISGIYYQSGDFYAPRHHHNFDQWRYQLEGEIDFNTSGKLEAGMLGYFPEGAYYGPNGREGEITEPPNATVVVQFGGPSGNGFLAGGEFAAAREELKSLGRFEDGVFHRNDGEPGRRTMDSFQATWEHASKRPMIYPQPQYSAPILMRTASYRWLPMAAAPGVETKSYGTFTDCAIRAASYKLDAGATLRAAGRGIFLVLSGDGTLEGETFSRYTALYLESAERASFTARAQTEILLLGLPDVARMRFPLPEAQAGAPA
jgi:hypothetical protein